MISVVIICRNEERLIKKCINSVQCNLVNQIIVVDSNSSDSTRDIVNRLSEEDQRIFLVELVDSKLTAALGRQKGIEKLNVTNEFVLFIDGDMELNVNFLDKAVNILRNSTLVGLTGQRDDYLYNDSFELVGKRLKFYKSDAKFHLGGAFIVKLKDLLHYGHFDIEFPILEETFFYEKFRKHEKYFTRLPDEMIIHHMYDIKSKSHIAKRIFDNKAQVYGIILYHIKKGQMSVLKERLEREFKLLQLIIISLTAFLTTNLLIASIILFLGCYLIGFSFKSFLRAVVLISLIPIGFIGEIIRLRT
jgi:glycosyltransferase involved in cell wall biosynthesis